MTAPQSDGPHEESRRDGDEDSTKANPLPSTVEGHQWTGSYDGSIVYSPGYLLDPPAKPESIGRIGEYDVQAIQGRGAMGSVFRAFDPTLNRTVAIKLMVSELSATPGARERFVREAQSAASINHANVVTVHAVGDHHGLPYLVMEFVHGQTLQELIRERGTLPVEDTLRIAHQIASGLLAAHQKGIVHRDVKPSNILIENGVQRVKIADFGLAPVALEASGLTSHGQTVGTPGYMSPEQVEGLAVDGRADLFSLGCVIYAMLTGHTPFRAGNTLAVLQAVAKQPHLPLSVVAPSTPPALEQFVEKLLVKDPNARLGSAAEALAELEELTRILGSPSRVVAAHQKVQADAARQQAKLDRWRQARWPVAGLLGMALLAAVFVPRVHHRSSTTSSASTAVTPNALLPSEQTLPAPAVPILPSVVVGNQPGADFPTVREALARDPVPKQIRIVTTDDHDEAISISGARYNGLDVVCEGVGALRSSNGSVVFRVSNVSDFQLRGARIVTRASQHGLMVEGNCSGLNFSDLSINQPPGTEPSALYFSKVTGGTSEKPLTVRRVHISGSDLAIALIGSFKAPVEHVLIEDCVIAGINNNAGQAVGIEGPCANLQFRRNRLFRYAVGYSIGDAGDMLEVSNNTLFDVRHFFVTRDSFRSASPLDVFDNLLIDVRLGQLDRHLTPVRDKSFHDNLRVGPDRLDWPGIREVSQVGFVSEDPESADFLRPAEAEEVRLTPTGGQPDRFAGALRPAGVAELP